MLNAEAQAVEAAGEDIRFEMVLEELWHLHQTLPLENYFKLLDKFVDQARRTLAAIPDPGEREQQAEQYRRVIEFAVGGTPGRTFRVRTVALPGPGE